MPRPVTIRSLVCLLLVTALGVAPACSRKEDARASAPSKRQARFDVLQADGVVGGMVGGAPSELPEPPRQMAFLQAPGATPDRKVIRTGSLGLEVKDLDAALERIRKDTAAAGGYIGSESHREIEHAVRSADITCRVPVARFDAAVGGWRALGHEESFSIAAEDITEAYSDTDVALRNQQKLETRLLELLNRQTNRLSDLLEIEKESARVRSEIETLEARKRLWDSQVALANLVVSLHEPRPTVAGEEGGPLHTLTMAFLLAANNFVDTVAEVIAAIGTIVPLLAVLIAAWLIVRALWRRRRR
jgi:hypothetical protein